MADHAADHGQADRETHQPSVVRMADDIARNLPHLPADERAHAVASHLRAFWDPRMRAELKAIVAADPEAVEPVVREAAALLP